MPLVAVCLLLQWGLFADHVRRDVAPSYPGYHDQLVSLAVAYEGYERARVEGVLPALRGVVTSAHPMGLLLPVGGWLAFLVAGPSRLHALAVNFAAYAVLQAIVVLVLRRLAGWPAAVLGWGLTWALRSVYHPIGGISDFRADFAALCLFAVFLGLALRSGPFESVRWSVAAGVAAAACVWARFLTIVHITAILGAFVAVMFLHARRASDDEANLARVRCRGAALCGLVMLLLSAPALWAQRAGIDDHYVRGILGPMRVVRAQVVGADRPLGNLLFYPQSLLDHLGPIVTALAAGLVILLAIHLLRGGTGSETSRAFAWLLALALVVPLVVLTGLTSKSTVVGGIMAGPLLWAIPLAAAGGSRALASRAAWVTPAGLWSLAVLVALAGAVVQYRAWHRPFRLDPGEVAGVFALYDAVDQESRTRRLPNVMVSADHVSDSLNSLAVGVGTYERTGRLLPVRSGLGSSIRAVTGDEALEWVRRSDFVILTVSGGRAHYPADRTLDEVRPDLFAHCRGAMRSLGRFRVPGREVELFASGVP